jgi:hypothetical protein
MKLVCCELCTKIKLTTAVRLGHGIYSIHVIHAQAENGVYGYSIDHTHVFWQRFRQPCTVPLLNLTCMATSSITMPNSVSRPCQYLQGTLQQKGVTAASVFPRNEQQW